MDDKETSEVLGGTNDADTKDESITEVVEENSQIIEVSTAPEIKYFNTEEDNNPLLISHSIKQKPKLSADLELIKSQVVLWRVILQRIPIYTHTDIKQEPMDVDQTDPGDVTTQLIPEGSEQHDIEDIKYVNTQDYLDIGETVISKQDITISEQDRASPGPSSKGDVRCQTNIPKNKTTTFLAGVKQFECDICGYKCRLRYQIERHIRTHTGEKPYKCEICDYQCNQFGNLNRHMKTHTGEKPYKCEICVYRCRDNSTLKTHVRTHTGEKPYKCEICIYQCTEPGALKKHMRTHTGEKPYKCEICFYQFTVRSSLKTHMRTHTGEKPYKCEICIYQCTEPGALKKHMRTHTGEKPYKCEICFYQCTVHSSLKTHMRTHTGEKPYKCKICDYVCVDKPVL